MLSKRSRICCWSIRKYSMKPDSFRTVILRHGPRYYGAEQVDAAAERWGEPFSKRMSEKRAQAAPKVHVPLVSAAEFCYTYSHEDFVWQNTICCNLHCGSRLFCGGGRWAGAV